MRDFYPDREVIIREGIADLRAAWAAHLEDGRLSAMIGRWTASSAEFARLWRLRDVRVNGRGHKRLRHPEVGELSVNFEVLTPLADARRRLVIYRAADADSQAALNRLTPVLRPTAAG